MLSILMLSSALAAVVPVDLILRTDVAPLGNGDVCTGIGAPFTTASGGVAYSVTLASGDRGLFLDDQPLWFNSDSAAPVLSSFESSYGATDAGGFIYSPSIDGSDGVWSDQGLLAVKDTAAPVLPIPAMSTFHSRPSMNAFGARYWIAGISDSGGTSTERRVLFRSVTGTPTDIQIESAAGDVLGGFTIADLDFDYAVSSDDAHLMQVLNLETGASTDDTVVVVDGGLIARESLPDGTGDNWDNFDVVAVNAAGNHLFSGDTDGATSADEFIAYNGMISVREGDVVDGITLGSTVRFASINNANEGAFGWTDPSNDEHVFAACDASSMAGANLLLSTGDEVDWNGDGVGDATVIDLVTSTVSASRTSADNGTVYVEVEVDRAGVDTEMIIQMDMGCCVDDDSDGLCAPRLSVTDPTPGQSMVLDVAGAPAGASVFVLVSPRPTAPNATCHPTIALCSDLVRPTVLGPFTADGIGGIRRTVQVPASVPSGASINFQAVWFAGGQGEVSDLVPAMVQ